MKWDSIKYYFDVEFNDFCASQDSIFLHYFSEEKEGENCYEKGSEKFILYEKIVNNKKNTELISDVNNSKEITANRKEQIVGYLRANEGRDNQSIIHQVNLDNYKRYYSHSFSEKNYPFVNLVNRLNILIYKNNYLEALNILKVFFSMSDEQMILNMNDFYFNHQDYSKIFSFLKKLKSNMKNNILNSDSDMIKKYFDLFLDNYSSSTVLKVEKNNLSIFISRALECPLETVNILSKRKCFRKGLKERLHTKLIIFQLLQLGDDSYDNLWVIN